MPSLFANQDLIEALRRQFAIDWHGHHGVAHWSRVRLNGKELASGTEADMHVIELFALFHDSRRMNEHVDDGHGARGFVLAKQWQGKYFDASMTQMDTLEFACIQHSDGVMSGPLTAQICWDADRLDLLRVGITPLAKYLCTPQAKSGAQIERSCKRALAWAEHFESRAM
jgi:uncharacterized protein